MKSLAFLILDDGVQTFEAHHCDAPHHHVLATVRLHFSDGASYEYCEECAAVVVAQAITVEAIPTPPELRPPGALLRLKFSL